MGSVRVGCEFAKRGIQLICLNSDVIYGEPVETPISETDPVNLYRLMG
jgi:hypothetical protein